MASAVGEELEASFFGLQEWPHSHKKPVPFSFMYIISKFALRCDLLKGIQRNGIVAGAQPACTKVGAYL